MKMQTYVMTGLAVRHGFQETTELQNGEKIGVEKWNKIVEAVNSTVGEIATYNGQVINAFFHSNSGGTTEAVTDVWGGSNYPYLVPVETSGEEAYTQYHSEVEISKDELLKKLKEKYSDISIDFAKDESIQIIDYTGSGRVKTVRFGSRELSRSRNKDHLRIKISKFHHNKRK